MYLEIKICSENYCNDCAETLATCSIRLLRYKKRLGNTQWLSFLDAGMRPPCCLCCREDPLAQHL